MAKGIALLSLVYGVCWSFLLFPWVLVRDQSLTGADLNQTLVLLPAISILTALIALYRKFPRALVLISGLMMITASTLAAITDHSTAPQSLLRQESITGIAGENSLGQMTAWPMVFAVFALASALISVLVARQKYSAGARVDEVAEPSDARGIWDEQESS
jgi:hypothetical protein